MREALRVLEQEGQVVYLPRRGYFITELHVDDLEEIYALRQLLEERAVRPALPALDDDAVERIEPAARDCVDAAGRGDVAAELAANRRFHFGMLESPDQPHTMRLIRLLWDSTEAYRALYYNSPEERPPPSTRTRRSSTRSAAEQWTRWSRNSTHTGIARCRC